MRAAPQSVPTMLSISTQFAAYAPAAQPLVQARASVVMESKASLEALAKELNPSIGYWDPIGLANLGGNDGSPASGEAVGADSIGQERFIGYLRHSEIKHGRIAMAGFVGYCLQVRVRAPAPPKDDGWARERERRRRHAGDDGPSEELREFSGERKGDDLDEIDI